MAFTHLLLFFVLLLSIAGCGSDAAPVTSNSSKYEVADEGSENETPTTPRNLDQTLPPGSQLPPSAPAQGSSLSPGNGPAAPAAQDVPAADLFGAGSVTPGGLAALPENATSEEAIEFFEKANEALRLLGSGRTEFVDRNQIAQEAKRISGLKYKAAENALRASGLPAETLSLLKRNKLEALSQLTGLQDVKAADLLEAFAQELIDGEDAALADEGRVVQIGFEMDRLRSGLAKTPESLIEKVNQLADSSLELGAPAFYALRQCYIGLRQYQGYGDSARTIRGKIIEKFAENTDPQIKLMTNELVRAERFDGIDTLNEQFRANEPIEDAMWIEEIKKLANPPDPIALQYISNLALGMEQNGEPAIAKLAFQQIGEMFGGDSVDPKIKEESQAFVEAYAARAAAIGQPLDLTYPDLAGVDVDWSTFRGSVVLMPFWQANPPQSLFQILPMLNQIRQEFGEKVKLVGVNLDVVDEELTMLRRQVQLDFPNLRNPDTATRGFKDPLALKVGCVTMPFLVVVAPDGKVAKIILGGGTDLRQLVMSLLPKDQTQAEPTSDQQ